MFSSDLVHDAAEPLENILSAYLRLLERNEPTLYDFPFAIEHGSLSISTERIGQRAVLTYKIRDLETEEAQDACTVVHHEVIHYTELARITKVTALSHNDPNPDLSLG